MDVKVSLFTLGTKLICLITLNMYQQGYHTSLIPPRASVSPPPHTPANIVIFHDIVFAHVSPLWMSPGLARLPPPSKKCLSELTIKNQNLKLTPMTGRRVCTAKSAAATHLLSWSHANDWAYLNLVSKKTVVHKYNSIREDLKSMRRAALISLWNEHLEAVE